MTVREIYPSSNRWDYVIGFNKKVVFVEVHSAHSGEVRSVVKKINWLNSWLISDAPDLAKLRADQVYFWIQSKSFQISKHSTQYRQVMLLGIRPVRTVTLSVE